MNSASNTSLLDRSASGLNLKFEILAVAEVAEGNAPRLHDLPPLAQAMRSRRNQGIPAFLEELEPLPELNRASYK